jgi:hypothetical protein
MAFVASHLVNHALGIHSLQAMEQGRALFTAVWRSWPGSVLLYAALLTHVVLVVHKLYRRRSQKMPAWEIHQIALGLLIPFWLVVHIIGTRGLYQLAGVDDDYVYILNVLWPAGAGRQSLLLTVVWLHGCIGIHFWLRLRPWYQAAGPLLPALALLLPTLALIGFVDASHQGHVSQSGQHIWRHLHFGRTRTALAHLPHCLLNRRGNLRHGMGSLTPLGDRPNRILLVVDFVQRAAILPDIETLHLTGQQQHRRRGRIGRAQRGTGILHTRARYHQGDTGLPRHPGIAVGHVCCRLLVTHGHDLNVGLTVEGVIDRHDLHSGHSEHHLYPFVPKSLNDCFTTCHLYHAAFLVDNRSLTILRLSIRDKNFSQNVCPGTAFHHLHCSKLRLVVNGRPTPSQPSNAYRIPCRRA